MIPSFGYFDKILHVVRTSSILKSFFFKINFKATANEPG